MINANGKDIRELNLEELDQVSGGGYLETLINRIKAHGHYNELKNLLKTQGKAAAAAKCCGYYPDLCGYCASAITML